LKHLVAQVVEIKEGVSETRSGNCESDQFR
jgi:hypothetical protein